MLRVATPILLALAAVASMTASLPAASTGSVSVRELQVPQKAKDKYDDAQRRLAKHDPAGARRKLEEALALAPDYSAAWYALGTIAEEPAVAETCWRRAVDGDPENMDASLNLGGLLLKSGRAEEAFAYNRRAASELPTDASAQAQYGMNLYQLGKLAEAERSLVAAKRIDPEHYTLPQLFLAEIYARRGEKARAVTEIEELLARRPAEPLAGTLRGVMAKLR